MRTLEEIDYEIRDNWNDFVNGRITADLWEAKDNLLVEEYVLAESSPTAQLCAAARRLRDEDA